MIVRYLIESDLMDPQIMGQGSVDAASSRVGARGEGRRTIAA